MERVTDYRIDTVEMTLDQYQRLSEMKQHIICTYGTWLHAPWQAAIDGDPVLRFEISAELVEVL